MHAKTVQKRLKTRLHRAKIAVIKDGKSLRVAAERYHIPKSTLYDYIKKKPSRSRVGRPPVLSEEEERTVVDTLLYFADC